MDAKSTATFPEQVSRRRFPQCPVIDHQTSRKPEWLADRMSGQSSTILEFPDFEAPTWPREVPRTEFCSLCAGGASRFSSQAPLVDRACSSHDSSPGRLPDNDRQHGAIRQPRTPSWNISKPVILDVEVAPPNRHRSNAAAPSLWVLLDRLGCVCWLRLVRGNKDWGSEGNISSCEAAGSDHLFKLTKAAPAC